MSDDISALAREGLQAWRRGDFETLEQLFAPVVSMRDYTIELEAREAPERR